MKEDNNNKPSLIDEIIESLDKNGNKRIKVKKRKNEISKIKKAQTINNEINKICIENQKNDEYVERISVYKVKKEEIKEEYDIIMDCDKNSNYIIYQKRK